MENQRKYPRKEVQLPVIVTNQIGLLNKGTVENLSLGGLLFRQKYLSCKLGSLVFVEIAEEDKFGKTQIPGEVVRVQAESDEDGDYLVGIKFKNLTRLSATQITELFTGE